MIEVTYNAPVAQTANGYAHSGPNLARYLRELGIDLKLDGKPRKIGMGYGYPRMIKKLDCAVKICFTMFESDKMPESWKEDLQGATEIVTPSYFCQGTLKDLGFDSTVVPLGIEHDIWPFIERPERDVFTFLSYESLNVRKGFFELFKAFTEEFDPSEPVRLMLKTSREDNLIPLHEYKNIEVIRGALPRFHLLALLAEADAFVFPSRGEGFGHTPLEALATGLPVIAPNAHGIATYFDPRFMRPFDYEPVVAKYDHIKEDAGNCIKANIPSLRKAMRLMYDDFQEKGPTYETKGRAAHDWVMQNWTYRQTMPLLADLIKKYAR